MSLCLFSRRKRGICATIILAFLVCFYSFEVPASEPQSPSYQASQALTFRLCIESQNNMPFINGDTVTQNLALGERGVLVDLLLLTARELGINLSITSLPWKRCIQEVKQGRLDGLFATIWSKEREEWAVFPKSATQLDISKALWLVNYPVYSRIHSDLRWNGQSFTGVQNGIGAPFGYIAYHKLDNLGVLPKRNLNAKEALPLVAKGRLDGYVIEKAIGDRYIEDLGLQGQLVELSPSFMQVFWFLPVSHQWYRRHQALTHSFWLNMASIRKREGKRLLENYANQ